ncbi:MAG TPA: hypothetical protein VN666_18635 [Nitrospira sp.]|nr:hypothetical protein [Nitrospira sp.]
MVNRKAAYRVLMQNGWCVSSSATADQDADCRNEVVAPVFVMAATTMLAREI